jgi:hypothetical protein
MGRLLGQSSYSPQLRVMLGLPQIAFRECTPSSSRVWPAESLVNAEWFLRRLRV